MKRRNEQVYQPEEIRQIVAPSAARYGVKRLYLFGSYARGEQTADSDIDILIQPEKSVGLFKLSGMHLDLQELLNLEVDLVTVKGLMPFARESADRDKILIYERAS